MPRQAPISIHPPFPPPGIVFGIWRRASMSIYRPFPPPGIGYGIWRRASVSIYPPPDVGYGIWSLPVSIYIYLSIPLPPLTPTLPTLLVGYDIRAERQYLSSLTPVSVSIPAPHLPTSVSVSYGAHQYLSIPPSRPPDIGYGIWRRASVPIYLPFRPQV